MARLRRILLVLLVVASLGWTAVDASAAPPVSHRDVHFLRTNEQTNLAEITLGKIALRRSSNPRIRHLAHMTMRDHRAAKAKLTKVAKGLGVALPTRPNLLQRRSARLLRHIARRDFALAYLVIQITGHRMSIANTVREIARGTNQRVKNYAAFYLPVAVKHLKKAQRDLHRLFG